MPPKSVRLFRPTLLRLESRIVPAAGALDPTFGAGGVVTTRFLCPSDDYGSKVAVDSQRRTVVAGTVSDGTNNQMALARYTAAGALDTSFGGTGMVTIDFAEGGSGAIDVVIDSQDRIVAVGNTRESVGGSNYDFAVARLTSSGALDTSFDGDGKEFFNFGYPDNTANSVAIDSLGRIVVAGYAGTSATGYRDAVARLTTAGALDSSFDGDGKFTFAFSSDQSFHAVAVDSHDRIVLGSTTNNTNGSLDFAAARLTTAGALDSSFDGDGKQTIDFGVSTVDQAYGLAVDSQDRVVIAGSTGSLAATDFGIVRLTAAGALDSTFDGDGKLTIDFGASGEVGRDVSIDSQGRLIVAGYSGSGATYGFAVARLTAVGALDSSFDGDGKQTITFSQSDNKALGVAVDSQDRVVVSGFTTNESRGDFAVARLSAVGALDSSFDGDGKQTTDFFAGSRANANAIAVDSLGRLVVAGNAYNGLDFDFAVARYTAAGALDTSFGNGGEVIIDFGAGDVANSVAVDSMGRIVVSGYSGDGANEVFAVARLTSSGALDPSFDSDGKQTIGFGAQDQYAWDMALDSLDRIVIAGFVDWNSGSDIAVARLTPSGSLDSSFDGDGKLTIDFGANDQARSVAVDSMNRVVIAGFTENYPIRDFAVARLTQSGALDSSFDGDGKQTIDFGSAEDSAYGIAIDSLSRIVVAGYTGSSPHADFAVARLTAAGALDSSFDTDGRQTIAISTSEDVAYCVAVDSQARVVLAGYTTNGSINGSTLEMAVARLNSAGGLDPTFDGDGKRIIALSMYSQALGVAVDSADRVLLAGQSNPAGDVFTLVRLTGDTTTASAQVNDGSAQRSRVTSLTIRFSSQVTFSGSPDQAFTLVRTGGGSVSFTATVSVQNGGTVVTLDHFTGSETEFGSLADGRYTLTALASQISANGQALDGDADGFAGGNFVLNDTQGLFRLFGDINGDQTVNGFDLGFFRSAFGTSAGDANYLSYLDLNGDGVINGFDLGQFRTRFGTVLP